MDFALDEQQEMVREMVRSFAEDRVLPGASERDRTGEFPHEIFAEMGELGLLGVTIPEEYGGVGAGYVAYGLVAREVERVDSGYRSAMSVQSSLVMHPIFEVDRDKSGKLTHFAVARPGRLAPAQPQLPGPAAGVGQQRC